MKRVALILVLTACADGAADYPVTPGGTIGVGVPPASGTVRGQVCRSVDLLDLEGCAADGAGGLTVALGDRAAVTADDGTFELAMPDDVSSGFTVSGAGAVTTTTPYSPSATVRVVDADVWARTLASSSVNLPPESGSILGTVRGAAGPATGISVTSTPSSLLPLYDGELGLAGGGLGTGARGVFLIPGVAAGATTLAFTPGETTVAGVSVVNGGVTILDSVALP
jgi:hypothetical protein